MCDLQGFRGLVDRVLGQNDWSKGFGGLRTKQLDLTKGCVRYVTYMASGVLDKASGRFADLWRFADKTTEVDRRVCEVCDLQGFRGLVDRFFWTKRLE